jgi:nuclear migration protein JNM1
MLDGISKAQNATTSSYGTFAKELGTGVRANGPPQTSQGSTEPSTYTITYAPTYQQSHALAKASDFDVRLSLLERSLGLNPKDLPASSSRAVIPTLETLRGQINLITESTPSSLDNISRRVRTLTQEAEKYEETRKSAKAARDALKAAGGEVDGQDGEDSEQTAKINALYGTLSTIENLAPALPLLLDRLRALRAIHADAATASDGLEKVEFKQAEMSEDIKKWRDGLQKMEEVMKNGQNVMTGNMKLVEGWVKDLEQKLQKL